MFEIGGHTVVLEFADGTPLAGAEVRASLDVPIRDYLAMQRAMLAADGDTGMESFEAAYHLFGETALISWNLARNGEPIPANGDGVLMLPFPAANACLQAWVAAVSGAGGNSGAVSVSGDTSQGPSVETAA